MIPKRIFTIWLGDKMPDLAVKCIESQKLPAYEHVLITLDNYYKGSQYVNDCIVAKHWVKAADWLRMYYLYTQGGIYLDADMEVLPGKNFDHLLQCKIFIPREECGHYGNAGLGSEANHPILKAYLERVENNFKGSGDLVYDPGIRCFTDICWLMDKTGMIQLPPHVIFPFNHQTRKTDIRPDTLVFHHFMKTWVAPEFHPYPKISILLPTLGRPEGLKRCLESIKQINYPINEIELIVLDGPETVPEKVSMGYKQCTGNLIVYAANDMEFDIDCLMNAVEASKKHGLVAFNSGPIYPDKGNICTHFMIRRDIVERLGEIFSLKFQHVGVDNLLWAKCEKIGEAFWCENAKIKHHHFTTDSAMDEVYDIGWKNVRYDRAILKKELIKL